jgi:hypothetical protein
MPEQLSLRSKGLVLMACVAIGLFVIFAPPLHQSQSYHEFADRRTILGIHDFWDVISNLPFLIVGLLGLIKFRDKTTRVLFAGVFFTAFGSAYYYLAPDSARLFWDRLPMTIAFMSLLALATNQQKLTVPFVFFGMATVVWWKVTDNLWLYGLVQFGSMAALMAIAIRREPGLWPVFILYGLSKISELFDKLIYSSFPISGHSIKHLLAGAATWYIFRWIQSSQSKAMPEYDTAFAAPELLEL